MSTYCSLFTRDRFSLFSVQKLSTVIIYRNTNRFAFDDDGWRFQLTCGISTSRVGILRKRNSLIGLNVFIQLEGRPRFAHRDRDRDRLEHAGSGGERRQVVARLAYGTYTFFARRMLSRPVQPLKLSVSELPSPA